MGAVREAWGRLKGRGTVLGLVVAAALCRTLILPLLENAWNLSRLRAEREEARERVEARERANAVLQRDFLALRRRDPFVIERLGREAGLIRSMEFDYASLERALPGRRALPSCPGPAHRTK